MKKETDAQAAIDKPPGASEGKIEFIPVRNLRFDPQNPRLPASVSRRDQAAILNWMLRDASILELMGSIGEKGYFAGEPLLVVPDGGGTHIVVEGNRRLCAASLLLNPESAPIRQKSVVDMSNSARYKPDALPVLVYTTRREILDYLGYRHVTGIKQWDPLAKAKYLQQLKETVADEDTGEQYKTLAKAIGSRSDYVASLLTTLAVYEKIKDQDYFEIEGLNEDSIDFSVLTTALSYSNIQTFLGLANRRDPTLPGLIIRHLEELTSWMFEKGPERRTRLGESRNLSMVNDVVSNERALEHFRAGKPLREAALLTAMPAVVFTNAINNARIELQLARDHQHYVDDPTKSDYETLVEIQKMARDLRTIIDSRQMEKEG